ncbi:MAG: hypothetical protein JXB38_09580 [Anaerolineales bacterium]|nr:hypothetical protein [Anaerolineales bacterium]
MMATRVRRLALGLYLLTKAQKMLRLVLRAGWVWGAVYLLAWGLNQAFGWFPHSDNWIVAGGIAAFVVLAQIVLPWVNVEHFLWNVDRRLGLQEQASAAWETTRKLDPAPVETLLLEDVYPKLLVVTRRVWRYGWALKLDLVANVIVWLLLLVVFLSGLRGIPQIPGFNTGIIPAAGSDPSAESILPSGVPGLEEGEVEPEQAESEPEEPVEESEPAAVEPVERLTGEGESFVLPVEEASDLLQAGNTVEETGGEDSVGGPGASVNPPPVGDEIEGVLDPYTLPWNYRHVVEEYFSPR